MYEKLIGKSQLPTIIPGEILLRTKNFQVVTDHQSVFGDREPKERFIVESLTEAGKVILFRAVIAHNIFSFAARPMSGMNPESGYHEPALGVDYSPDSVPPLFLGKVEIPSPGGLTVPSIVRMEQCIEVNPRVYTFADDLPEGYGVVNPQARRLRFLQATHLDDIPDEIIHSDSPNRYFKVRKGWFYSVHRAIRVGLMSGEFKGEDLLEQIRCYSTEYSQPEFLDRPTVSQDIAAANALIDAIWNSSTPSTD